MVLRLLTFSLILAAAARGEKMDPVVPEKLIPPSPVLTVAEALKSFKLAPGFVIEPVAAEPLVDKPVCLDFDSAGRMWVCEMTGYMPDIAGKGESVADGRIVIIEDTDGDGKADKRSVFLDKLVLPRAVAVFESGVLFMDESRCRWIARNGDKPSGEPIEVAPGIAAGGNVEHKANGLLPNLDNRIYLAKSDRRLRRAAAGWVAEPTAFRGQWGIACDDYGRLYHNNNSTLLFGDLLAPNLFMGNPGVKMKTKDFVQLGSNRVWPARVTPGVNRAYISKAHGFTSNTLDPKTYKLIDTTAASGMTIYRGSDFPEDWYGMAFTTDPVANLVKATKIEEKDGIMTGSHPFEESEFLASTDERFRPVNAYNAPDGTLVIVDMYHGIMQHKTYMTPYLRKQTLERNLESPPWGLGRIYRIRSATGKRTRVPDLSKLHGVDLVKTLAQPDAWQREMGQRLMVERKEPETIPWLTKLVELSSPETRIRAIWTLEGMGELRAKHLVSALRGDDGKLQSSALWASTRLPRQELVKLTQVLLKMQPAAPEVLPYLCRALGPLGTPEAFTRLAALLEEYHGTRFTREAAVSGLDGHEKEFRPLVKASDKKLLDWLDQGARDSRPAVANHATLTGADLAAFERGKTLFHGEAACFGCHSADGAGMPNLGPPLDGSQWVAGKPDNLAKILLHGLAGPVTVDGERYTPAAEMPGLAASFSDQSIADIMTYIRNEWSNHAAPVTAATVETQRKQTATRGAKPWTVEELTKQANP